MMLDNRLSQVRHCRLRRGFGLLVSCAVFDEGVVHCPLAMLQDSHELSPSFCPIMGVPSHEGRQPNVACKQNSVPGNRPTNI